MNARFKKWLLVVLKVAILAGIVEYARRQSQVDDELAVPDRGSPALAQLASRGAVTGARGSEKVVLTTPDGYPVEVAPGARLRVVGEPTTRGGVRLPYLVETKDARHVNIAADDVENEMPEGASRETAPPFTVLPGLRSLFRHLDLGYVGIALALFGPALLMMAMRWRILLLASSIDIPVLTVIRLHYMGFFLNSFMPGGAGGDIIKAVYVARYSSKKAEAATMVVIDRVVGLLGLLMMVGCVVLIDYEHLGTVVRQVSLLSLSLTLALVLYFSAAFRRLVRYDALLARLPRAETLKRIDDAFYGLRHKKGHLALAFGLTLVLQLLEVIAISFAGRGIGIHRATFTNYLAFVPIGYLVNAVPISFGGIGLMEGAYLKLFRDAGVATATQGFMLGILSRLLVVAWSLLGAPSALFPPEGAKDLAADRAPAHAGAPK